MEKTKFKLKIKTSNFWRIVFNFSALVLLWLFTITVIGHIQDDMMNIKSTMLPILGVIGTIWLIALSIWISVRLISGATVKIK